MQLTSIPFVLLWLFSVKSAVGAGQSAQISPAALELFEKEVRPILVERCQSCHGEAKAQGGLRLISRSLILKGGSRGPALVAAKPNENLLIKAVEYHGQLKMPPTGRIPDIETERLKRWIASGAPWPEPVKQPGAPENG